MGCLGQVWVPIFAAVCLRASVARRVAYNSTYIGFDGKEHYNPHIARNIKRLHRYDHLHSVHGGDVHMLNHAVSSMGDGEKWTDAEEAHARDCLRMMHKHKKHASTDSGTLVFSVEFYSCREFLDVTCHFGKDGKMDGDESEHPSGEGFCTEWISAVENFATTGDCESHPDLGNCTNIAGCAWNGTACNVGCALLLKSSECEGSGCTWDGARCQANCVLHTDAPICGDASECSWNGSACRSGCLTVVDDLKCSLRDECQWGSTWDDKTGCAPACSTYQAKDTCDYNRICEWNGTSCETETGRCAVIIHMESCVDMEGCLWEAGKCRDSCRLTQNQEDCINYPMCYWEEDECYYDYQRLPEQGFQGDPVAHHDMQSNVKGFGREYGPRARGNQTYEEICAKYPENQWCKDRGYHHRSVAKSSTSPAVIVFFVALSGVHLL